MDKKLLDKLMKIAQHCGVKFHWESGLEEWYWSCPGVDAYDGVRQFSEKAYPTFHEALVGALGEYQNADSHFLRYGTPGFNFSGE